MNPENKKSFTVKGIIADLQEQLFFKGEIWVEEGVIKRIVKNPEIKETTYILPGLIDAHVHIESSMLIPSEFARLAVCHGTVATVSDPHEIANVCGIEGVDFMINNGKRVTFKFYFGAPSCVPATCFETAGAEINSLQIERLLKRNDIKYLAEMMNWPGVLFKDKDVMQKIEAAKKLNKPVDGHAPGLRGEKAIQYISAGISTDHECFSYEEALDKLKSGMKIIIREGSAARNFDALIDLIDEHEDQIMFCSDDKHPDNLLEGHINELVRRAIKKKKDIFKILKATSINPVNHYKLEVGLLKEGDPADFILIDHPDSFNVLKTYINGKLVAEKGKTLTRSVKQEAINNFNSGPKTPGAFKIPGNSDEVIAIEALDGQLITNKTSGRAKFENGFLVSNPEKDILKIAVVNRYKEKQPAVSFIKNFGLKTGALASCIAHDSHNIIAVGVTDNDLCNAVNEVIKNKGGICVVSGKEIFSLPLPIAGIMTNEDAYKVAANYTLLDKKAKELGTKLKSPFMTLSFMALLVIPSLKLSDLGLFDGDKFEFVN